MPEAAGSTPIAQGSATSATQSLEDRYGTSRRRSFDRRFAWGAAVALVAGGVAFLAFSGWQQTSQVSAQDIGYTKNGDASVDAKFIVTAPANTPVACAIEALNKAKAPVGWKVVEVPVSDATSHTVTTRVITTNPATAVTVQECWVIEERATA
ncbi:DUF4307 domain-containing protein [Leucobacter japonicus]|uniref:DUF4307 domain-containing protein n=1 Tax=Leucobacter japonicus TaxID=1461259 RepID=UPI000B0FEFB1|nr:DUF4307 domain-containing protein [Leucobacter japonicus]